MAERQIDEVDQIVSAWRAQLSGLDAEPMQVWSRISRLNQLLATARAEIFSANELAMWEFDVLAALRRAGRPYSLTAGQLVEATHVTSGTMTNRITRLAERGLIVRSKGADRRSVIVALTELGRQRADSAITALTELEGELLGCLDESERQTLVSLLRRLLIAQS